MPARTVERIEKFRHGAAGLAQGRDVAAQSRHPKLQRLDHREAEPFGEGRQQQRARAFAATRTIAASGNALCSMTVPRSAGQRSSMSTTFSVSQPRCPTSTRTGAAFPELAAEPAPQIEQQQVVLARLDRADIDEIRPSDRRGATLAAPPADRRRTAPPAPAGPVRRGRDAAAAPSPRHRRIDDQRIGEFGRGLDPAQMVFRLARLGVFGKLDRDQVMDQADEPRRAALFQARDQPRAFRGDGATPADRREPAASRSLPNSRRSLPASSASRAWRAIRRTRRSCARGSRRRATPRRLRGRNLRRRRGSSPSRRAGSAPQSTPGVPPAIRCSA